MEETPQVAGELVEAVRERFGLSLDDVADGLGCSLSTVRRIHAGTTAGDRYLDALRELSERGTVRGNQRAGSRGDGEPEGFARWVSFASNGDRIYSFVLEMRSREAKAALCAQVLQDLQRISRNENTREKHVFFGVDSPAGSRMLLNSRAWTAPAEVVSVIQGDFEGSVLAYLADRLGRSSRYGHQHAGNITSFGMNVLEPRVGHERAR